MFKEILENVKRTAPLIHSITNYVTANDCANLLLACGASPIMADDPEEAAEITALSSGLNLNLGTLHRHTIPAMQASGRQANAMRIPVLLDPVGVGASKMRTDTARTLLRELSFTAIRGNSSEIKTLALGAGTPKGVDAAAGDAVTRDTLAENIALAQRFSKQTGAVVLITGAVDIVADQAHAYCIYNGHPMMRSVTGTGCQLSALTTAFLAANPQTPLLAAAAAVCAMGLCGELAQARLTAQDGSAALRGYILDALYNLTPDALERGAKYEMR